MIRKSGEGAETGARAKMANLRVLREEWFTLLQGMERSVEAVALA